MSTQLPLPPEWGMLYAAEISDAQKRMQHEAAHCLLHESLKLYGAARGIAIADAPPQLSFGKMGKPALLEYPKIRFNLSHCSGLAVCLYADHECGVDCEGIREYKPRVAQRVCSDEELAVLEASEERDFLFTRLWTLKEAYVKALGIGISYPMREAGFSFTGDGIVCTKKDASFMQLLLPSHIVSVCVLKEMQEQRVIVLA